MRILVTGGSGFIGSHLVEALLDRGAEVTVLAQEPLARTWLKGLPVREVRGDLREPSSLVRAVQGAEAVCHLAGKVDCGSRFSEDNTLGTANLARVIKDSGRVRKVVFTSSLAAQGPSPPDRPHRSTDNPRPISLYGLSKLAAERILLGLVGGTELTILRPGVVFGPRDRSLLGLFWAMNIGLRLEPLVPDQRLSMIQVEDLVRAIIRGLEPGRSGIYLAAHPRPFTSAGLLDELETVLGVRSKLRFSPGPLAWLGALVAEGVARTGIEGPHFGLDKIRELTQSGWWADPTETEKGLDWEARVDHRQGLAEVRDWYRARGWIGGPGRIPLRLVAR